MKEIEVSGHKIQVVSSVDAVGLFCPMPIVHLQRELQNLNPNHVVEIFANDSGFGEDLIDWCKETGHTLISLEKNQEDIFVAYVEKR